jgi:hypothetical protein
LGDRRLEEQRDDFDQAAHADHQRDQHAEQADFLFYCIVVHA